MARYLSVLGVVALAALGGCRFDVTASVKSGDLFSVLETGKPLGVPLTLSFQVIRKGGCGGLEEMLEPKLADAFGGEVRFECDESAIVPTAAFTVQSEVVHELADKRANSEAPVYLGVYSDNPGDPLSLAFFRNREAFFQLLKSLETADLVMFGDDLTPALSVQLANDGAGALSLGLGEVFIDGEARPSTKLQEEVLDPEDSVKIGLSDVAGAALFSRTVAWYFVATLKPM